MYMLQDRTEDKNTEADVRSRLVIVVLVIEGGGCVEAPYMS